MAAGLHALPAAAAPPPPIPKVGRDGTEAGKFAAASGSPVEIANLTTETSQTFANADGTLTSEVSNDPVRVKQNGAWRAVDATLEFRSDGSVAPKAAVSQISLSGGGTGPIGKIGVKAGTWTLKSPWPLPRPTLSGSTATYTEVTQGVDLVVDTTVEGFSYNLVVKTREAASNPALKAIHFPVATEGLSLRTNRGAGPAYVDADGRLALTAGDAIMWDAAKSNPQGEQVAAPRKSAQLVEDGPAGAHSAEMELRGDASGLTMIPDAGLLTAPTTVYPVVLDPPTTTVDRNAWAAAWQLYPTTSFFKTTHSLGVGYEDYEQHKIVRSFFQFDTRGFRGKKIISATLQNYETHSASCAERSVSVTRTTTITDRTTWNNQPGVQLAVTSKPFAHGYNSTCPDAYVEFPVTNSMVDTAAKGYASSTFRLAATNESDGIAWKQFSSHGKLRVTYATPPDVPRQLGLTDPAVGCDNATSPTSVGSINLQFAVEPILQGRINEQNAQLKSDLWIYSSTGNVHRHELRGPDSPGTVHKFSYPNTGPTHFTDGATYHYRARSVYELPGGAELYSGFTGWCYFRVDRMGPPAPIVTAKYGTTVVPNCTGTATCEEIVPFSAAVTFTVKGAVADVVRHDYWWDGQVGRGSINAHTGSKALIPPREGLNKLTVQSFDPAGHGSKDLTVFRFATQGASPPVGDWSFDDGTGTTAVDAATPAHPLTVFGGGAFDEAGRDGKSIRLDGVDDYAETPSTVVDTSKSFTVSAWARLWTASDGVVVSVGGNVASAFDLSYAAAAGRWVFQRSTTDAMSPAVVKATSNEPAVLGAWTHLTGVYDSVDGKLQLYVNGRLQTLGNVAFPADKAWKATGPLSVGRGQFNDVFKNYFPGSLDRVQIWQRAMNPQKAMALTDVRKEAESVIVSQAARWQLNTASKGADQVWRTAETVYGANMVMSGFGADGDPSTSFVEDDERGGVLHFSGVASEALSLPRPVVDAGTSFSVAVWVKLADATKPAVIARQAGSDRDAWRLEWRPSDAYGGDWVFSRGTAGEEAMSRQENDVATADWQLLIATYDANLGGPTNQDPLGKIGLTVNKTQKADALTPYTSSSPDRLGSTVVGKGRAAATEFAGLIDELRMYVGPLVDSAVCREFPELGSPACPPAG